MRLGITSFNIEEDLEVLGMLEITKNQATVPKEEMFKLSRDEDLH
jgi:hypothetical protein